MDNQGLDPQYDHLSEKIDYSIEYQPRYIIEESETLVGGFEVVDSKEANLICMCYTRKNAGMIAGALNSKIEE